MWIKIRGSSRQCKECGRYICNGDRCYFVPPHGHFGVTGQHLPREYYCEECGELYSETEHDS